MFQRNNKTRHLSLESLVDAYQGKIECDATQSQIIESILSYNEGMIVKLAYYHATRQANRSLYMEQGDFLSEAVIAMMEALRRYDNSKIHESGKWKCAKPSSFLYTSVYLALCAAADNSAGVRCVEKKRALRSYHQGRYDDNPQKKRDFETKMGWVLPNGEVDKDSIQSSYMEHVSIIEPPIRLHALHDDASDYNPTNMQDIPDPRSADAEDELLSNIALEDAMKMMTQRQKDILSLMAQSHSAVKISEMLGITTAIVRNERKKIREVLKNIL